MAVLLRFALLGVLASFFLACGSGKRAESARQEDAAAPAAVPIASAAVDPRPAIVAFGDSLSAGFGLDAGKSFPDDLQQLVDRAGYRYRVVNLGVSGDTTTDGLERLPSVLSVKPVIVILEFGGNDGLRGQPVVSIGRNLAQIIEQLQASGAQVVLAGMTLPAELRS